jgi:hypothetical protein
MAHRAADKRFAFLAFATVNGTFSFPSHGNAPVPVVNLQDWGDWKAFLRRACGLIEDSYGSLYSLSEFESMVEGTPADAAHSPTS